jgi:hypothetical protein
LLPLTYFLDILRGVLLKGVGLGDLYRQLGALVVLAVAWLLLLMGRSGAILDAAYGLPLLPGTEELIALAEAWHAAMEALGIPALTHGLRAILSWGRA